MSASQRFTVVGRRIVQDGVPVGQPLGTARANPQVTDGIDGKNRRDRRDDHLQYRRNVQHGFGFGFFSGIATLSYADTHIVSRLFTK